MRTGGLRLIWSNPKDTADSLILTLETIVAEPLNREPTILLRLLSICHECIVYDIEVSRMLLVHGSRFSGSNDSTGKNLDSTPHCSRVVPHPSTNRAQTALTSGVRMRTGGLRLIWSN
jgi:hypothetical protein